MPRGFTFRLEALLRVRRQARDAQQRVVAEVVRRVKQQEAQIRRTNEVLRTEVEALRTSQHRDHLDLAELQGHRSYMGRLHRELREAAERLSEAESVLDQERAKLAEASKQHKVIEKLKEKQYARYRAHIDRMERMLEDESGLQQYLRNNGEQKAER